MAQDATFIKGDPEFIDYTPGADLTAGAIVLWGATGCLVLHSPGLNGVEMGAAAGGGVYEVTLGGTLAAGALVDFNNTTKKMVAAGTGDAFFGKILPGQGGSDTNKRRVKHLASKPS